MCSYFKSWLSFPMIISGGVVEVELKVRFGGFVMEGCLRNSLALETN